MWANTFSKPYGSPRRRLFGVLWKEWRRYFVLRAEVDLLSCNLLSQSAVPLNSVKEVRLHVVFESLRCDAVNDPFHPFVDAAQEELRTNRWFEFQTDFLELLPSFGCVVLGTRKLEIIHIDHEEEIQLRMVVA